MPAISCLEIQSIRRIRIVIGYLTQRLSCWMMHADSSIKPYE
uniref:Aspartyl-tRNA synthetase n=1 Tax=Rhizophora mucronata TaxID=61149 RepID=A0A2P2LT69_RHIMU